MKVGILTWHKAINHGAVLQAYASCEIIKVLGYDPKILNYSWNLYEDKRKVQKFFRRVKTFSPQKAIWFYHHKKLYKEKIKNFEEFVTNKLPIGKLFYEEKNLDAVYIGSDMVFDITQGYNPYMYGLGVPSNYIFSYAASFGYTTINEIKTDDHYNQIVEGLSKMKAIGYRDENTKKICEELNISVKMTENIDPVLCYGFEKEISAWDSKKWRGKKYILIYAYGSLINERKTISQLKKFSKEKELNIISCGYYHSWCDENIPASPQEFLEMFKYAKYVVTDTFHGTIFSLILHKKFVTIISKNGFKVKYLLDNIHMSDRIKKDEITKVLIQDIDYKYYDNWIENARKKSKSFINLNLEKAQKNNC